jgi:excisionase family DNA binding protein
MEKITATVSEACQMTGLGKTKIFELLAAKKITGTLVGKRRLIHVESLRRLLGAA